MHHAGALSVLLLVQIFSKKHTFHSIYTIKWHRIEQECDLGHLQSWLESLFVWLLHLMCYVFIDWNMGIKTKYSPSKGLNPCRTKSLQLHTHKWVININIITDCVRKSPAALEFSNIWHGGTGSRNEPCPKMFFISLIYIDNKYHTVSHTHSHTLSHWCYSSALGHFASQYEFKDRTLTV